MFYWFIYENHLKVWGDASLIKPLWYNLFGPGKGRRGSITVENRRARSDLGVGKVAGPRLRLGGAQGERALPTVAWKLTENYSGLRQFKTGAAGGLESAASCLSVSHS